MNMCAICVLACVCMRVCVCACVRCVWKEAVRPPQGCQENYDMMLQAFARCTPLMSAAGKNTARCSKQVGAQGYAARK